MDELEVSTTVYVTPQEAFEFLLDFPSYANYSDHLVEVEADGDGSVGTEYVLHFAWWRVRYSIKSSVTAIDPPNQISFELRRGPRAEGEWIVEPIEDSEDASFVRFVVRYDPASVTGDAIDLPAFLPLSSVVRRVEPRIQIEAERILERVVVDLEGRQRPVDVAVTTN